MENAIMRNVKNISFIAGKMFLTALGIAALLIFLFAFGEEDFYQGIIHNLPLFGMYVAVMEIFSVGINTTMIYMPIVLSFPSRRKDFIAVKTAISVAVILVISVVVSIINSYSGDFKIDKFCLTIAALIALSMISNVCGIVIMKFGMAGYIIFIFVCGFIGGIFGFFSGCIQDMSKSIDWNILGITAITVSVLLFIIFEIVEWKIVSKYEVKQ